MLFNFRLTNHNLDSKINGRVQGRQDIDAGHQRVDELFFRKLSIPLPPIEKQNEIADHIQTIRNQAKQLRAEAAAGLEKAKQEVEAMILGDGCNE